MGRRVTSVDVAREAGVSQSAVSRAFNPGASISDSTRARVEAAAKKLGYRPNAMARTLISRRSNMIGLVMADLVHPFYAKALDLFLHRFQELGHRVMLFTAESDQPIDDLLPQVLEYQVDGVVIASAMLSSEMADHCLQLETPVTLFNRYVSGSRADSICCDNIDAARAVADLLLDGGHRQLAYIAGQANTSTNQDREMGFLSRVHERRAPKPLMACGNYSYQGGFDAALALFDGDTHPDAIFCASDIMGIGAMDALRNKLGLSIPEDVSVVAFDDVEAAAWHSYRLTTIRPPLERMVDATVKNMLARIQASQDIQTPEHDANNLIMPGELVVRHSARLPAHIRRPFVDERS